MDDVSRVMGDDTEPVLAPWSAPYEDVKLKAK
jgi:hypothetical protein